MIKSVDGVLCVNIRTDSQMNIICGGKMIAFLLWVRYIHSQNMQSYLE